MFNTVQAAIDTPLPFQGNITTSPANQSDQALIRRVQRGEQNTFTELISRHQDAVYRQAYYLLGDPAAAEDAAQEAFFRAYTKIGTFDGPSFRNWVLRIAINYCYDQMRKQKRHPMLALEPSLPADQDECEAAAWLRDPGPSPEQLAERSELRQAIRHSLMTLAPAYRTAVILVDVQELDYQTAAEVMGLSLGTFKSRLYRARLMLIEKMERAGIRA